MIIDLQLLKICDNLEQTYSVTTSTIYDVFNKEI